MDDNETIRVVALYPSISNNLTFDNIIDNRVGKYFGGKAISVLANLVVMHSPHHMTTVVDYGKFVLLNLVGRRYKNHNDNHNASTRISTIDMMIRQ